MSNKQIFCNRSSNIYTLCTSAENKQAVYHLFVFVTTLIHQFSIETVFAFYSHLSSSSSELFLSRPRRCPFSCKASKLTSLEVPSVVVGATPIFCPTGSLQWERRARSVPDV